MLEDLGRGSTDFTSYQRTVAALEDGAERAREMVRDQFRSVAIAVAINGEAHVSPGPNPDRLNDLGGQGIGVGRAGLVENHFVGMKSASGIVRNAPGAAHDLLERIAGIPNTITAG